MKKFISFLLCSIIFLNISITAKAFDVQQYLEDVIYFQSSGEGAQYWIDTTLAENAGISSEWYIFALHQYGNYDFTAYQNALENYLATHEIRSASSRLKYALAFLACNADTPYISESLGNSIGQQGIMSWIYGLHVINNGYTCDAYSTEDVINHLLSAQLEDNGWAVMGTQGDIDVTAMTVQAFAPYYDSDDAVRTACDNALQFLSERQLNNGGYQSFGTENLESTAQVVTALSALGIDAASDERFIKENYSLLDAMDSYRLSDGTFCHVHDGGFNETATIQAFYTLVAYYRMQNGQSPLYVLDKNLPVPEPEPETILEIFPEAEIQALETETESESDTESSTDTTTNTTTTVQTSAETSFTSATTEIITSSTSSTMQTTVTSFSSETVQTTTTTEMLFTSVSPVETPPASTSSNWKIIAFCIIGGIGLLSCILLFVFKKKNLKNFLFVGILVVFASGIVFFIKIESPDAYYQTISKENSIGSVQITIRCDTLLDKADSEYIPPDGVILEMTQIPLSEGETVYDILTQTAQSYHIQMEHNSSYYISGINYLYEMQYGDLSGWMYKVNGELPSVGCAEYTLHDGDVIEWLYSCDIGNDLN